MAHDTRASTSLGEATWNTVATPILAVPIGSCEQHGPHLPLDTDTRIACAVADGLAAADPRVRVAPALGITASGEHAGFPGTLSIGLEALEQVLVELVRSADWSSGIVFVNGHGGNRTAVERAIKTLLDEDRRALSWWPTLNAVDAHAGRTETSLLLAIDPTLVRMELAAPGVTAPLVEILADLRHRGVAAVSPSGVLGDPTGSSPEEGRQLLGSLVQNLVDTVAAWTS